MREPSRREPITIPAEALVLLVGPAGAGKTTFAARHFAASVILSSDAFRERLSGDARDQRISAEAFRALHLVADERLRSGQLTVIDATNVLFASRAALIDLAAAWERPAVAIVLDTRLEQCLAWNSERPGRMVPAWVVRRQHRLMRRSMGHLDREGFAAVHVLAGIDSLADLVITVG